MKMRVLHPERPVETELMVNGGNVRRAGAGLDEQRRRVARHADKEEDRQRQQKQREQRITDPPADELLHDSSAPTKTRLAEATPLSALQRGEGGARRA